MGSKISGALIGRITSSLRKMYQQKRKEVKEHNESIENGSKTQRVSQNQIRKYILKGESDNPKLAELYSRPLKSTHLRDIARKQCPADFFNK